MGMTSGDGAKRKSPIEGYSPLAVLCKFLGAAFFGCLVSGALFLGVAGGLFGSDADSMDVAEFFRWDWFGLPLAGIPILWGVLGIFCFDRMLELGEKLIGSGNAPRRGIIRTAERPRRR